MGQIKPQPAILTIWRIFLGLSMLPIAFLAALLFHGHPLSFWLSAAWIVLFLAGYLAYLPIRYQKLSFTLTGERILVYSGVLYTRVRYLPVRGIQFTTLYRNPLDRVFGLCSLVVTSAGGRIVLPGLRRQDAEELAQALLEHRA